MRIRFAAVLLAFISALIAAPAGATWKPEYADTPQSVQQWFQDARTTHDAYVRLGIALCCKKAERLRTKFVASSAGEWSYYPDPNCISAGCPLRPIPNDVVHSDEIRARDPKDNDLPEFKAMRREGVLFIYHDAPSCF